MAKAQDDAKTAIAEILPILEQVARAKKPLLLVASDVTDEALATLIKNHRLGALAACVVRIGAIALVREIARLLVFLHRFLGTGHPQSHDLRVQLGRLVAVRQTLVEGHRRLFETTGLQQRQQLGR